MLRERWKWLSLLRTLRAVTPDAEPTAETDPVVVAQRERDEYRDALQRLQADFENYKKRMIKQQTDHLEHAAGALVDKLLAVLDTAQIWRWPTAAARTSSRCPAP